MATMYKLKPHILKWEGGYSNHPLDKGGMTNKGITLKTFRSFYGEDKTVEDLKNITDEQWDHIFKTGYWDPCKGDLIENQRVANIIVDWAWGSGVKNVIKHIQKALGLQVDGILGPISLSKINASDCFTIIYNTRKQFYENIVKKDPTQKIFLKGWINRLNYLKETKF